MSLIPVNDAWKVGFITQLLPSDLYTGCTETNRLGRITDAKHGHPLSGYVASLT